MAWKFITSIRVARNIRNNYQQTNHISHEQTQPVQPFPNRLQKQKKHSRPAYQTRTRGKSRVRQERKKLLLFSWMWPEHMMNAGEKGHSIKPERWANFMQDRYFTVTINNETSTHEQENGIPQGSVISPTIFTIMVNDLGDEFTDMKTSLSQFADNAAI
uniref:Reverse transcriptase domain-containing protein n=2 Tax=Arion vulgaris TaxID=1028688 RepID=A0A0B7AX92_9EUPU